MPKIRCAYKSPCDSDDDSDFPFGDEWDDIWGDDDDPRDMEAFYKIVEDINHQEKILAYLDEECWNVKSDGKIQGWGKTEASQEDCHLQGDYENYDGDDWQSYIWDLEREVRELKMQVKVKERVLAKLVAKKKGEKEPVKSGDKHVADGEKKEGEKEPVKAGDKHVTDGEKKNGKDGGKAVGEGIREGAPKRTMASRQADMNRASQVEATNRKKRRVD
ncbi:hypothetical protein L202_03994 [Cryptococcus amylolentus CBS 6039]|uniref:Uncharacterized protein n=2 Tax=Cryptococcus amylolentus TaxID=104669 RepID=A0A1E3HPV4_9TREE|nr:hypothetical protein L202_03994 [Cryptococcus amylolentus CBS 6039]ODN78352.1 hypothetical protein L202_03994 [Cryptococcus amylolentus CBS 6039]ODO07051.1 hypothetical protein I350_04419 [Cryptococcus amylolentus CBS 6273]